MSCPSCREAARFVAYRPKTVVGLLGAVRLERAYYHCPACRSGSAPWDGELGLAADALTPAAREVACLAGAVCSFAEASATALPKLAGLRLGESTVERAAGVRASAASPNSPSHGADPLRQAGQW